MLHQSIEVFQSVGLWGKCMFLLVILFLLSMMRIILWKRKQEKYFEKVTQMIEADEYIKVYTRLLNAKGRIEILEVDGKSPFYSNDVLETAFYLLPGRHLVIFKVIRKSKEIFPLTPYYDTWGPFQVEIEAKGRDAIVLCVDGETQERFLQKIENLKEEY